MSEQSTVLKKWIQDSLTQRGWSQSELARRAELSSTTISDVLTGSAKPGFNFCKGVARAFGVRTEKVLRLAGLLQPEPEETATITEFVYALSQLPPDEQEKLLLIAQSWIDAREREKQRGTQPRTSEAGA